MLKSLHYYASKCGSARSSSKTSILALDTRQIRSDHFVDEWGERDLRLPTQFGLGGVAEQDVAFGRTLEGRINHHIFFMSSPTWSRAMRHMSRTVDVTPVAAT